LQLGWATRPDRSRSGPRRAAASAVALALHRFAIRTAVAGAFLLASSARAGAPPVADVKAEAVARSLSDAMGGQATWSRVPYLRFDFVILRDGKEVDRRSHWWDKAHSRYRAEWKEDDGSHVAAVVNLLDRSGKSSTDGKADTDTLLAKHVREAYEVWVNDTYWLIMPFKLGDPGAHLRFDHSEKKPAGAHDVLSLTFDSNTGLTPKDHYWLYINQSTHLLDRWEFLLQGRKPPPAGATWEEWEPVGPLRIATLHRMAKGPMMLRMENLAAPATMDDALFNDPRPRG
jgi:hypothetical protein